MKFAIVIFSALILLLLAGVLPVGKGMSATAVYYSPLMILLLGLLSVSSIKCCWGRARPPGAPQRTARRAVPTLGFLLVHLGVVVILAGAFLGYIAGTKGSLQLSLNPSRAENRLMTAGGNVVDLGFSVSAENFDVQFYPPVYTLFQMLLPDAVQPGQMPFERAGEFDPRRVERWEIAGKDFEVATLRENGVWAERYRLEDGSVLIRGSQTPSHYGVTLRMAGDVTRSVRINHPADYKGWRFYLMSYDRDARRFVQLSVRRDPGRRAVIGGIWMVILGTFTLCFRKVGGECRVAGDGGEA